MRAAVAMTSAYCRLGFQSLSQSACGRPWLAAVVAVTVVVTVAAVAIKRATDVQIPVPRATVVIWTGDLGGEGQPVLPARPPGGSSRCW